MDANNTVTIPTVDDPPTHLDRDTILINDLFPPDFMRSYTDHETIGAFFSASPWTVESTADFRDLPADAFDEYVTTTTVFDSWELMLTVAAREWLARHADHDAERS